MVKLRFNKASGRWYSMKSAHGMKIPKCCKVAMITLPDGWYHCEICGLDKYPENLVLRHILNLLATKGYMPKRDYWRNNTAGIYNKARDCYQKNPFGAEGLPDIMGFIGKMKPDIIIKGTGILREIERMFAIECKSASRRNGNISYEDLSDSQKRWKYRFEESGGLYIEAKGQEGYGIVDKLL